MYTLSNTISEILDDEKVTKDFYLYCPKLLIMISDTHEISVMALTQGDEALIDKLSVELHACSDFPKTFLWANDDDLSVPPSNAERLALRLCAVGVPVRYCRYPQGGHGCGLGIGTSCENWLNTMTEWINADESE